MLRSLILVLLFSGLALSQTTDVTQTDTATTITGCATVCTGATCASAGIDQPREMGEGATAGSTSATETHAANTPNQMIGYFRDPNGIGASCDTGTATTRLNVTTAGLFTVTDICICAGSTVIGSATGLSISLNSTGVKTQTVSVTGTAACASSEVQVVYCGDVGGSHGNESYSFTPDQNHTIPTVASTRSRAVMIQ